MDRIMYTAVITNQVNNLLHNKDFNLDDTVTPNGNTLLHVIALLGGAAAESTTVSVIMKSCPALITRVNSTGETPLHIASREGHFEVVRQLLAVPEQGLIDQRFIYFGGAAYTTKLSRVTSDNGDTALHNALRFCHLEVARLLVDEDPEVSHPPNLAKETPLYLAAERSLDECVKVILKASPNPCYSGPGGRTALHAAVIVDSQGCTMELLRWKPDLADIVDRSGWTPLHHAANFGHLQRAKQLLDLHTSAVYANTEDGEKNTALHIATKRGHVELVTYIITKFPTCVEIVSGNGQNVLHVAAENKQHEVIRFILQSPFLSTRSLINQQDHEGNTPLHLLAASGYYLSDLVTHPKAEMMVFNKDNSTPLDIVYALVEEGNTQSSHILEEWKHVEATPFLRSGIKEVNTDQNSNENPVTDLVSLENTKNPATDLIIHDAVISIEDEQSKKEMKRLIRLVDVRMVVAAIIATITFTAGFTMPGGFIGNDGPTQGMAALTRLAAFRAFVISDALSLTLSSIALVIYFVEAGDYKQRNIERFALVADILNSFAILAMMVAFMTGTYAVLMHSLGLAIATNVLCSCFFIVFFSLYYYKAVS